LNSIYNEDAYERAKQARIRANAKKGRGQRWLAEDASRVELQKWLYEREAGGGFLAKMADSLFEWGSLSPAQEAAVRKIKAQREEQDKERAIAHAAKVAVSEHVGAVGDKLMLEGLKVEYLGSFAGQFGYMEITKLVSPAGEAFCHMGRRPAHPDGRELAVGDVISMRATVKRHCVYQGLKETMLVRPKILAAPAQSMVMAGEVMPSGRIKSKPVSLAEIMGKGESE
jgi:hypothetical protein